MTTVLIETGLRAIDLLAPLAVGLDVLVTGDPKSGVRLLAMELAVRLAKLPASRFGVSVFLDAALKEADKVEAEFIEAGSALASVAVVPEVSSSALAAARSGADHEAVLAVAASNRFVHGFRQALRLERESRGGRPLTTLISCEDRVPGVFDATITCSRTIADEAIFPAIDPRMTVSSAGGDRSIGDRRRKVADDVRTAVSEVVENLYQGAVNDENWFFNTDPGGRAAVQLLCYLSQPYFVAEPYTGLKGCFVPVKDTVSAFETLLAGRLAQLMPRNLRFRNELPT